MNKSEDIVNRKPVWEGLSNLFLDTDTNIFTDRIVHKLVESPYSFDEIEIILSQEVYPACYLILISIAGAWGGFDEELLTERILK